MRLKIAVSVVQSHPWAPQYRRTSMKYPYARPEITNADRKSVLKVLDTPNLTQGKFLKKFESDLSKKLKSKYVILCNSGTAALHIVYSYLGLRKNEILLTTPLTFVATANAAIMNNSQVLFSDVDENTGLITAEEIEKAIKKSKYKVRIISVVHLTGRLCEMEKIKKVADKYKCYLVEDACHALGAYYFKKGKKISPVGSCKYSIATTFSFHAIKHVAVGEGGCIATNNQKLANFARRFIAHGINREVSSFINKPKEFSSWYYEMVQLGYNYKINEMSCALGVSQLKRLQKGIKKRINLVKIYNKYLDKKKYITIPNVSKHNFSHAWHLYSLLIDFKKLGKSRAYVMKKLAELGIGTQVHYIPVNLQPFYYKKNNLELTKAKKYYYKTLSLPLHTLLEKEDISFIAEKLLEIIRH